VKNAMEERIVLKNLAKYTTWVSERATLLSTEPFLNGNGLYATGQLLFLAQSRLPIYDAYALYPNGIELCRDPHTGAYARRPDLLENTSVDDYLAITCDEYIAQELLKDSRANWGFLDVHNAIVPGINWAQFIFRFQGLWQHMRVSAGERLGLLGQAIWAVSIVLAARKPLTNQDSWIQSHLMVLTYGRRSRDGNSALIHWLMDLAVSYWRKKKGTTTTSSIMAAYCGDPEHPLVEAWEPYN
jgi:hypothetical protein